MPQRRVSPRRHKGWKRCPGLSAALDRLRLPRDQPRRSGLKRAHDRSYDRRLVEINPDGEGLRTPGRRRVGGGIAYGRERKLIEPRVSA